MCLYSILAQPMIKLSSYRQDFKLNLKLALPIMAGQVGQVLVNFIDNIMVGQLGASALAAVSLAISIYISLMVVGMGISFALPPLVAQAHGMLKHRRISVLFKHSLLINVIYALICILIIEIGMPILDHLGQDPEVVALAKPYLRISGWTMIPLMIFQALRCHSDGLSETKPAMIATLVGNVFNVLFNYMLIYGKLGAPALGVEGAAFGTFLARILMIAIMIAIMMRWKDLWSYIRNADYKVYQAGVTKKLLSLGIPTSMQMFFEVTAFAAAALIMGTLGKTPQAAHQIAINLAAMTFLTCTGLGMAATIRVGNQLGQNNTSGLYKAGMSAIIQVVLFMLIAALLFIGLRDVLPQLYIDDKAVIKIASVLLIMAAIFQVSDGIQVVALGVLRGMQDVKVPMVITFLAYWVCGIPISYIAARYLNLGPVGVWMGLVIGLTISAILLTRRFIVRSRMA